MALKREDTDFRFQGISYLDYKQIDMDRVLTAFFARLAHNGLPSRLARTTDRSVGDYVATFLERKKDFAGFDPDITYRWVETHLLDMVNRGKATQAVAGLRPLHGYTYRFRNARKSRSYNADEQLYEMMAHASDGRGAKALTALKSFFFSGVDTATETLRPDAEIDVETQALISLSNAWRGRIPDRPDTGKPRTPHPPLIAGTADLLVDDVFRLLFHRDHMPRSVLVDYLKILFAFHLALYHLRILKTLPAMVKGGDATAPYGFFLDVTATPGSAAARLAERSAAVWYGRIPAFIQATFTVKKLDELARHLVRRGKRRAPANGVFTVPELLRLLGPAHKADRAHFAGGRLTSILDGSQVSADDGEAQINRIFQLGLDEFTTYIEVITTYRADFHRKYLTECLDSLLLKKRPGAMIAQPRGGERRFVLDSRLLEVLLQISLLRPGGRDGFHTAELRVDAFLDILRERYGLYVDRLPAGDGFDRTGITDQAALRANRAAFVERLREIGFYNDLSDAYLTQTITPRYRITANGTTR